LPEHVRAEMQIVLAERVEEALAVAIPHLATQLAPPGK
jgi:hypothetical protein